MPFKKALATFGWPELYSLSMRGGENGARLNRLRELVELLHARPARRVTKPPKPKAGDVKAAVVRILELSVDPMSLRDVLGGCEAQLGRSVPYNTVKDCVFKHSRDESSLLIRTSHGCYTAKVGRSNTQESSSKGPESVSRQMAIRRRIHPGL